MHCDALITIIWIVNSFINDISLPCRRKKNQSCQVIRFGLCVFLKCFSFHLMLLATLFHS